MVHGGGRRGGLQYSSHKKSYRVSFFHMLLNQKKRKQKPKDTTAPLAGDSPRAGACDINMKQAASGLVATSTQLFYHGRFLHRTGGENKRKRRQGRRCGLSDYLINLGPGLGVCTSRPLWRGGSEPHADEADEADALAETCVRKHDEIDMSPERSARRCSCSHMY